MVLLFLLSFAILPYYIQSTLQLLDPRTLAELISSEGINAFRKNEKQKVIERIEALGDLAIKALDRSEEEFVINFLNSLQDLQDNLISGDWSVLNRDSSDNVLFLFDNGISSPIVDQYNRIFRRAVAKKQESISIRIAHLTSLSVDTCLNREGSKKQLIGILRQFRELFREAVDKKDESRFIMVLQMHNFLFTRILSSFFLADYLPHCLSLLRDMNKIILDCADFDLWKKVLDHFSAITSVNQLSVQLQHIFLNRLNNIGVRVSQEELNLLEIIQTRLTSGNQQLLEFYLERRRVAEVEEDLNKLWLTTCIFDVFFEICVYACYHKKYQYIHELWRHTNPPDASAYWCNTNLIQFHPGFLLYQSVSELTLPWDIESYHGASAYISKYFLYSLAYALSKFHCDWHPALPIANWQELQTNSQYSRVIGIALRDLYIYLINLPTHVDVVLSHFDTAMDDKQEWEGIFDGNASVALELARNWLTEEDRQQEWKTTAESILINLPLFQDYVQVYQQNAIEEYHSQSILNELAIISTGTSRKRGQKLTGRNIIKRIDKTEFTLINIAKPEELVNRVGYEAIGQIVNAETNFVIQKWLSRKGKTYITVKNLTYKVIAEATKEIHKTGHEATVIIVPWQQYAKA